MDATLADKFRNELEQLLNKHSLENNSNTPDFILAEYLVNCLGAFDLATEHREEWYGHKHIPGQGEMVVISSGSDKFQEPEEIVSN